MFNPESGPKEEENFLDRCARESLHESENNDTDSKNIEESIIHLDRPSLSADLIKKKDELYNRYDKISKQSETLERNLLLNLSSNPDQFFITKNEFIENSSKATLLNPNDLIEIKINKSEEDSEKEFVKTYPKLQILIRNKRIAEEEPDSRFDGIITDGNIEELSNFIAHMKTGSIEGRHIGYKGDLERTLDHMKKNADEYKLIVAKDKEDEIIGVAVIDGCYKDKTSISTFVVDINHHNQGTGSAILSYLKSKYKSIHCVPIPKTSDPNLPYEYFQKKLDKFYKENGFIDTGNWNRSILSMDDKMEAGKWQEINSNSLYLGINKDLLSARSIIKALFTSILANEKMKEKITPEEISSLEKWKRAYDEKEEIFKEIQLINEKSNNS